MRFQSFVAALFDAKEAGVLLVEVAEGEFEAGGASRACIPAEVTFGGNNFGSAIEGSKLLPALGLANSLLGAAVETTGR